MPAREEGCIDWIVDHMVEQNRVFRNILDSIHAHQRRQGAQPPVAVEHVHPWVDRVFSPIYCYPRPEVIEIRLPIPPPGAPRGVSSASGSGCRHVVGESQDGNPDQ